MGNLDSEYPTNEQVEDSFKAYKENGREGILAFLKEQRRKREAEAQAENPKVGPEGK